MESNLASTNFICSYCSSRKVTHFCTCNTQQSLMCDKCMRFHSAKPSQRPHLVLPISCYQDIKIPGFLERKMTLQSRKEELERQIRNVAEWKKQFQTEVEQFKWQIYSFQESMDKSWDGLYKALREGADKGVKEAEASLRYPNPTYQNHIASWLMTAQRNSKLLECTTDFSKIFTPMKDCLDCSKVLLRVNEQNVLEHFTDENIVIGSNKDNKDKYIGRRDSLGRKSGYGVCPMSEDVVFEGIWENDQPVRGKSVSPKGVFIGRYSKQRLQKHISWLGILAVVVCFAGLLVVKGNESSLIYPAEGVECLGAWESGELTGWGTCTSNNGTNIQSGRWKAGKLHGIGEVVTRGQVTLAEFEGGEENGIGLCYSSSNEFRVGVWRRGKLTGPGLEYQARQLTWGNFEEGMTQGNATCVEASGVRYVGQWSKGTRHGNGVETYPAESLKGFWSEGKPVECVYNYTEGYKVQFENNLRPRTNSNNIERKGSLFPLEESWLTLVGPITTAEGLYYGQVNRRRERHGYGVQNYTDGSVYAGHWQSDLWHGEGRWESGEVQEGYWHRGVLRVGSRKLSSGTWFGSWNGYYSSADSICMGLFDTDQVSGFGVRYTSTKELAVGAWREGMLHGLALEVRGETLQEGNFKRGKLEGGGSSFEASGTRYVGQWRAGLKQGSGLVTYPAEYFQGMWTRDSPAEGVFNYTSAYRRYHERSLGDHLLLDEVWLHTRSSEKNCEGVYQGQVNSRGQRHGYGVQNYTDGSYYEGHWKLDIPHGHGVLLSRTVGICTGYWDQGHFTVGTRVIKNTTSSIYWSGTWNTHLQLEGFGVRVTTSLPDSEEHLFGHFVNGKLHGFGALVTRSRMMVGEWDSGMLNNSEHPACIWEVIQDGSDSSIMSLLKYGFNTLIDIPVSIWRAESWFGGFDAYWVNSALGQ